MRIDKLKLMCTVALAAGVVAGSARAQSGQVLSPGDAVVTGFSGIAPLEPSSPTLGIDLNGPSAQIMPLSKLTGPPAGAVTNVEAKRKIEAKDVGQVFAVALDDGDDGKAPNIYLGATSLFGLNIVEASGKERLEIGEPGATFMKGQFGPEGSPGSIWKVDGTTGEISEFTSLPDNSGAGVGDVVFDSDSGQFFAADLDNGLIYRISKDGEVIDSFDHGTSGRTAAGLEAVADDGSTLDITSADFDSIDPETWGYTPSQRRVWGMAINDGRLYYAIEGEAQIWSVGIGDDGSFAGDAKLELTVEGLTGNGPITDMLFDADGRMYLSQRGVQKASFNYSEFAEQGQASVLRYVRAEDGTWDPVSDTYAIGMPPEHDASNGGISLGYDYDANGVAQNGKCNGTLWTTGDRLVANDGSSETPADVHGLQGNSVDLVRPENVPPSTSYFLDYDGLVGDAQKAGHMGDVEVFQPCEQTAEVVIPDETKYPPGFFPPGNEPPDEWPEEWPEPEEPFDTNLQLTKTADPKDCLPFFGGWSCQFKVTVTNTGPSTYFGDILVKDTVPGMPAGAFFGVGPVPPWSCWSTSASSVQCWRPDVLMNVGQFVELKVNVWLPNSYDRCRLRNIAEIEWAPGGTRWNTDPGDDRDGASARVPLKKCLPVHKPIGSVIHQPQGSIVHRPRGSDVHRPRGSDVHRPRGSIVHRPRGSDVHRPRGSDVHRPRGSNVHRPRGSDVHRPRGSDVHRPRGSEIHLPRGSDVHRPRGSRVHGPRSSPIHRPRGSDVHRPRGSRVHGPRSSPIHRPRGSRVHRPRGSKVHVPRGSKVHRPRGSRVHVPRGSKVHRPRGSRVHRPRGSKVHRPRGSRVHRPRGSRVHRPRGSRVHVPRGSRVHRPRGSRVHRPRGSRVHRPRGSRVHRPRGSRVHRPRGSRVHIPGLSSVRKN